MEQPMQNLSAEKLLAVWETGRAQHALDRALTLLAAATPGTSRDALADLTVGERDARLLQLRALVVGSPGEGFAECPRCAERVEFPLETASFVQPREVGAAERQIEVDGTVLRFRLPTSRDLAAVVAAADSATALAALLVRCVDQTDLPNDVLAALSRAMLAADPQAEILLALRCPACGHAWETLFDIADFFWSEISARAQRLLREIDALARAYGWTEQEILNLSAQRRQTYLELVAA